jgi:membrane-bound lytic murein transglycosylase A
VRELSWPAIRAWAKNNPEQLNALLWSNPRVVFFNEEALPTGNASGEPIGPRGAAGVALSAGRSIAVDPQSIPYGTPVWLASSGDSIQLSRLVIAQDTGAAIKGAVRADYFVGSGEAAGDVAGRLKQPLQLWVLWPK